MLKKFMIFNILFSASLLIATSCANNDVAIKGSNGLFFKVTAEKAGTDLLYEQYLEAKRNLQTSKVFPGTSEEYGPGPNTTGISVPDSTPYLNLELNTKLKKEIMGDLPFPTRAGKIKPDNEFQTKTCCGTAALHRGTRIAKINSPTGNKWGVYAGHKVNPSLSMPNYEVLYSPTTMPPNKSNLEATVVYDRWFNGAGGAIKRFTGVWNHYLGGSFKAPKQLDDSVFLSKYVGSFTDGQFYFIQIEKTSGTSSAYKLMYYNFQNSTWENQYTYDAGTYESSQSVGWSFHEPKWDDICPSLSSLGASDVKVWNGSSWYLNTSANGGTLLSGGSVCTNWNFNWVSQYHKWTVN